MCGIAGILGRQWQQAELSAMVQSQRHRGPDADGIYVSALGQAGLGHNRLSIIDLSPAGRQPMCNRDGTVWITFNGEIYNYLELRAELADYPYQSRTDTEVILAAYERWGDSCVEHFVGMFAFLIWDERQQRLFAARDRFGVKPLYYNLKADGTLLLASEIKALHQADIPARFDETAWATYLTYGLYDHHQRTFWQDIFAVPPGHTLIWEDGNLQLACWYDLAERVGTDYDLRPLEQVQEEYLDLLTQSVRLRFRADVPVGINLSGGLDSSTLLGLVQAVQGTESVVGAFTFVCDDPRYDELPWVEQMLEHTQHPLTVCRLRPEDVPAMAEAIQAAEDEPFGGLPTLAYARVFEEARARGVIVLLDGQGMDEQWAGYDYYSRALNGAAASLIQGTREAITQPEGLTPEFRARAQRFDLPQPFPDALRNLQYRDIRYSKIPKALRFNDRISMRCSTELREPFLDHRLLELAFRQPADRKILNGVTKATLRRIARQMLPATIVEAPKRPLQTPQREWLRGPLREWANDCVDMALGAFGDSWFEAKTVRSLWQNYCAGSHDNSFFVWQWINLGLTSAHVSAQTVY
jgi:asparagine synthase (glutamine-hydrolysing)